MLAERLASVTVWLPVEAGGPCHIVDLGCGTGAGTLALLQRLPGAQVTAVDTSAAHLRRIRGGVAGILPTEDLTVRTERMVWAARRR
ncbi:trans-aconitate 2-methyltransferase [Streptomyces sp. V3I8]|uniref:class I SAM-dependent methyltransferase n=1 Tax=Streptomyces sp. V3I8 TaxID=3042279 RepID=UPI00359394F1